MPTGSATSECRGPTWKGLCGSGPVGSPYLYAKDDPAKLLLSAQGSDVPRNHEGIALIGDVEPPPGTTST